MKRIVHKPDVVETLNFFSKSESKDLIDYFEKHADQWEMTCFYNARVMSPDTPAKLSTHEYIDEEFMKTLRLKLQVHAEDVFSRDLRNLSLSAHKWLTGAFAGFHADNAEMDGTPNAWRENKLVTIVYLNDDYEGGNLVFRDHPIDIAPKTGSMIVFDVGHENIHGVTEVTAGTRWTMLASFDYADSEYPDSYWAERDKELREAEDDHDSQHEEWQVSGIDKDKVLKG